MYYQCSVAVVGVGFGVRVDVCVIVVVEMLVVSLGMLVLVLVVTPSLKLLTDMPWTPEILCTFSGWGVNTNVRVRASGLSADFLHLAPWFKESPDLRSGVNMLVPASACCTRLLWICCCCERVCAENLQLCCASVKGKLWIKSGPSSTHSIPKD